MPRGLGVYVCRNVREIHIAFRCVTVPLKHRVDGLREFGATRFVNTTAVNPEILQPVLLGLLPTKLNLLVASLAVPDTTC